MSSFKEDKTTKASFKCSWLFWRPSLEASFVNLILPSHTFDVVLHLHITKIINLQSPIVHQCVVYSPLVHEGLIQGYFYRNIKNVYLNLKRNIYIRLINYNIHLIIGNIFSQHYFQLLLLENFYCSFSLLQWN